MSREGLRKMKYLNIWNDIHPIVSKHGNQYLIDYLIKKNKKVSLALMCAEEASMHDIQPFLTDKNFNSFRYVYMVQGGFDLRYYDEGGITKFKNIDFDIWPWYFIFESAYHSRVILDLPVEKLFICMNYKPRIHRKKLLDQLAKVDLLDSNYITWHQPKPSEHFKPDHFDEDPYTWENWNPEARYLEGIQWDQYCVPDQMFSSVINLVSESFTNCPFVTEKTWNAIFSKKPFIILGYPGIHKFLKSKGYKLPSQINYEFDNEEDTDMRIKMIAEELHRLSTLDLQELNDSMKDVCEHNYKTACNFVLTHNDYRMPVRQYYGNVIQRARAKIQFKDDLLK